MAEQERSSSKVTITGRTTKSNKKSKHGVTTIERVERVSINQVSSHLVSIDKDRRNSHRKMGKKNKKVTRAREMVRANSSKQFDRDPSPEPPEGRERLDITGAELVGFLQFQEGGFPKFTHDFHRHNARTVSCAPDLCFHGVRIGDLLLRLEKRTMEGMTKENFFTLLHELDVYNKKIEIEIEHGKHKKNRHPGRRKS